MRFKGRSTGSESTTFQLNYTGSKNISDSAVYMMSYVSIYGFDLLINSLEDTSSIDMLIITNTSNDKITAIDIDSLIERMPNLEVLTLDNVIDKIPKNIYNLDKLEYLNLTRNPSVHEEFSIELGNMENIDMINLKGSPNIRIPQELKDSFKKSEKTDLVYMKIK